MNCLGGLRSRVLLLIDTCVEYLRAIKGNHAYLQQQTTVSQFLIAQVLCLVLLHMLSLFFYVCEDGMC